MAPQISAVINNFNYRHFIGEAIESALAQSSPVAEVVVVDDGSTDGSVDMIRRVFRDRVRLIASPNRGQLSAIALGAAAATSSHLAFLDADDRWRPDHIATMKDAFGTRCEVDCVIANNVMFGEAEGVGYTLEADEDLGVTSLSGLTREWVGAPTSCLVFDRTFLKFLEKIPEPMFALWKTRADDVLIYGSSIAGARKLRIAEPTVEYRIHGKNNFHGRSRAMIKSAEYERRRRELLDWLNAVHFPGCEDWEIIRSELWRNRVGKLRNRRNLLMRLWRGSAPFTSRLRLTTAILLRP